MSDRTLLCFAGRTGDRNDLALAGARVLSASLSERLRRRPKVVGAPGPGLVPSEYQVPGGLTWDELEASCSVLEAAGVVGFEIAEYEATWLDGRAGDPVPLFSAIAPLVS